MRLTEDQIDDIVTTEAENDAAWEEPILVRRPTPATISLPPELATRAAFSARLHRASSIEDWLNNL